MSDSFSRFKIIRNSLKALYPSLHKATSVEIPSHFQQ